VPNDASRVKNEVAGVIAGIFAYTAWGFIPIYFKQLVVIPPLEVLAWRIVFCVATLLIVLLVLNGPRNLWLRIAAVRQWGLIVIATVLIAGNWYFFIVAISVGEILQTSLGYFLVPIINTALGVLAFGERPNQLKRIAVGIAFIGMLITFIVAGVVPIYSLILACTFGLYGMVRKHADVDSTTGLLLETLMLLPLAAAFLYLYGAPLSEWPVAASYWLTASGVVTLLPLLTMVFAARNIELGTLGFIQYITPVMHFFVAVWIYNEAVDLARFLAFITTAIAVSVWIVGSFYGLRTAQRTVDTANEHSER